MSRNLKRMAVAAVTAGALLVLFVAAANAVVLFGANGNTSNVADAPEAQAALVLGAGVRPDGTPTPMLADRIAVGAELYRAGKVDKVLASGDHGTVGYDEVNVMKRELIERGVDERDLFTDHAGFDTWDSSVRAKKVFDAGSVLVVTQRFHLPRAVWLARRAGLDAHGVSADRQDYGGRERSGYLREVFGRVKAVGEVATNASPRYLGPKIPISGDGRDSAG